MTLRANALTRILSAFTALFSAIIAYFLLSSGFTTAGSNEPGGLNAVIIACGLGLFLLAAVICAKKRCFPLYNVKIKAIPACIAIFVAVLVLRFAFFFYANTEPTSDFQTFYWLTSQISRGDLRYLSDPYFGIWGYQIVFPWLMSPVAALTDSSLMWLIGANCAYMAGSAVFVYLLARKFSGGGPALLCAAAYALLPYNFGLASVYTNQHAALFFTLAGIYALSRREKQSIPSALGAGALFALANLVRPEGMIVAASLTASAIVVIPSLARGVSRRKTAPAPRGEIVRTIASLLLPAAMIYAIFFAVSGIFVAAGLSSKGLSNAFPQWKFVVGLNRASTGHFNYSDEAQFFDLTDESARGEAASEAIAARLSEPGLAEFLWKKSAAFYAVDGDYWCFRGSEDDSAAPSMAVGDTILLACAFLGLTASSVARMFTKKLSLYEIALSLFVCAFVSAYVFIEIQTRYLYPLWPVAFLAALPSNSWEFVAEKHAA